MIKYILYFLSGVYIIEKEVLKMKNLFSQNKWLRIVAGIILFSLGLVTLIISLNVKEIDLLKIVCIIVAVYCFSIAIFSLLVVLIAEKRVGFNGISGTLLTSGVLFGIGAAFCFIDVASAVIHTIIGYCLPLVLISIAVVVFIKFLLLVTSHETRHDAASWVRALVIWVLLLTAGIVFFIQRNELHYVMYSILVLGILVMIVGVLIVAFGIVIMVREKKAKKAKIVEERSVIKK